MTITASTGSVSVRGVDIFWRRVGNGPEAIALHGGPGAHHDYLLPAFDNLARGRSILYYDQRGGGRSPVAREIAVGWEEQVADLEALRSHWDLDQLNLIGYSWGGLLALLYLVNHPDRVARLALVSPAPAWREARDDFEEEFSRRNLSPDLQRQRHELRDSGLRQIDEAAYRQRLFELSVTAYFYDANLVANLTPFRLTGRTQQEVWDSLGDYDLRPDLTGMASPPPTLVIHGADDPIPVHSARDTAQRLAADFILLPQCGHVPYVEAYDEFHRLLDGFLPSA